MGMFDTIRSSYDLGPGFWNRDLQTKDLVCMLSEYWISPNGELFEIDYSGTVDWGPDLKTVSNGNRGKVRPVIITREIEVYPTNWDAHWSPFPRLTLYMEHGTLTEYRNTTPDDLRL